MERINLISFLKNVVFDSLRWKEKAKKTHKLPRGGENFNMQESMMLVLSLRGGNHGSWS